MRLQVHRGLVADAIDRVEDDVSTLEQLVKPHRRLFKTTVMMEKASSALFNEVADALEGSWPPPHIGNVHAGDAHNHRDVVALAWGRGVAARLGPCRLGYCKLRQAWDLRGSWRRRSLPQSLFKRVHPGLGSGGALSGLRDLKFQSRVVD